MFSRTSCISPKVTTENNGGETSKTKPLSPVSSPDIIPPSPVLDRKKGIGTKKKLNYSSAIDVERKEELEISQTSCVSLPLKKKLDLLSESSKNTKDDNNDVESQSWTGTESMASTICDETDYYSDLILDDWDDKSSIYK